ncbi:MAG: hypothetical protein ACRD38_09110 [Nitrososphaerales archaeon]
MKMLSYAAVSLGLMLVLSAGLVSYNIPAIAAKQKATIVTIDEFPTKVRPGDQITLTGMLTTADGEPISQSPVNIYILTSEPQFIVVATGVTGIEGTYEVVWDVELVPIYKAIMDVTKSFDTQVVSLLAQFEGDEFYAASKTGKTTVTIEVNSIKTFVTTDKKVYKEGETAIVFIGFVDSDDVFLTPDSINANFNQDPIADKLELKKVGSFTFITPALQKGHNQVSVVPDKEGYNTQTEVVTITVLTPGSVGPFGFQ